ncbi:MAG TPA: hypothetical protein PLZ10_02065 [Chitinophagaceae bacterium]|jgi:hypothetical protein|nr:hypothetical protein [Chitinophagaceae bacterium]
MKKLLLLILFFISLNIYGQEKTEFDGHQWVAPYYLPVPKGWTVERFPVPPSFAITIPYKGVEDIRFTPGWGKIESNEYWSYAFLWFLDDIREFDSKTLENNLTAYYTGLFNINTSKSNIDTTKLIPVQVTINSKKAEKEDDKTFEGIVKMNDYMTKKPITLNLIIHIKSCEEQNKSFVLFELSPRPYSDMVWNDLDQLWLNFKCNRPQ